MMRITEHGQHFTCISKKPKRTYRYAYKDVYADCGLHDHGFPALRLVQTEGGRNATGVWYAVSICHTGRYICAHISD